ncbi:MAG: TonB-dependent receptor [Gammaproteobacteria bacterium]|nr:TonB-dependent receptor [Gammaproteobacteria bacterium]
MNTRVVRALRRRPGRVALAAAAWAGAISPAIAQIEEVIVTAQKREERLQDVSVAVTALSGDTLRENDIAQFGEIANNTPGLIFNAFSVGQPEIAIRGVSTKEDGAGASEATVVSVDGIYIAARSAQVFDIFDLERVEVLRGPQSTLYGKNTIAGAVNFVTSKPGPESVVRLRQTVGDYGRFDTAGLVSGQIAGTLYGKFSFSRRKHDGYLTNILPQWIDPNSGFVVKNPDYGKSQGESNTFSWRTQLRFEANESLQLTLMVDGADDHNGATNREPIGSMGPLHNCGCASDPVAVNRALGGEGDLHTTLAESEGFMDREALGIALVADVDTRLGTWTTTAAYRGSDFDWLEDSEGLPPFAPWIDLTGASGNPGPLLTAAASRGFTFDINNTANEHATQYTFESRIVSPGGARLDWLAGAFLSSEEVSRREGFEFPTLGGPGPNANSIYDSFQLNKGTSWAAFAQATFNVTERFGVTGGLRYSWDRKDFTASGVPISGPGLLVRAFSQVSKEETWSNVSGRLAADFRPVEDMLLYASISTGYKAGGFPGSPSTAAAATTPFGEETALNYELGFKSELLDRRLRLNLAAFLMKIKDLQVTRFFQPQGNQFGEFLTENAGEAESKGAELEVVWQPLSALQLGGSYAWLNAEYTDFRGAPSVEPNGTILQGGAFNGKKLRQSPENTFNLYGRISHDFGAGRIWARVDFRHEDEFFFDPSNDPITASWAHDIWNARLAYETGDGRWQFSLWGKNLGDEQYLTHLFTQRGGRIAFGLPGDPRTWGVSVEMTL